MLILIRSLRGILTTDEPFSITYTAEEISNNPNVDDKISPLPMINNSDLRCVRSNFQSKTHNLGKIGDAVIITDGSVNCAILEPWTAIIKGEDKQAITQFKDKLLQAVNENRDKKIKFTADDGTEFEDESYMKEFISEEIGRKMGDMGKEIGTEVGKAIGKINIKTGIVIAIISAVSAAIFSAVFGYFTPQ